MLVLVLVIRRRHKSFAARYPASVTLRPSRARYGRLRHLDDDHDDDHDHDHELRATSYELNRLIFRPLRWTKSAVDGIPAKSVARIFPRVGGFHFLEWPRNVHGSGE